jgi:hypothetical protein
VKILDEGIGRYLGIREDQCDRSSVRPSSFNTPDKAEPPSINGGGAVAGTFGGVLEGRIEIPF